MTPASDQPRGACELSPPLQRRVRWEENRKSRRDDRVRTQLQPLRESLALPMIVANAFNATVH
jgi:hypothetical protein